MIQGGNTFYGSLNLTNLVATALTGATAVTQQSSINVQGDLSAAIYLVQGTKLTGDILLGGGGIVQNASDGSTESDSVMVDLDGTLNGTFFNSSSLSGVGPGLIGIQTLGGIHSCASDTGAAAAGFTCPVSSGGSFVNDGAISLTGTAIPNSRGGNLEAGSAIIVGGSIDGRFPLNGGPRHPPIPRAMPSSVRPASSATASTNPTVLIDPAKSITGDLTTPRAPITIGR